jgi:tetratricopeptide (TPR) repeat protein
MIQFVEGREYCGLQISVAQRVLLKAIYGLPMAGEEELAMFCQCTGRLSYGPGEKLSEVTIIAGARSGKDSRIAAPIALYEAIYGEYQISRGEPVVVPLVAQDGDGAGIAFSYIKSYAHRPRINVHVDNELSRELWVRNVHAEAALSPTEREEDPEAARVTIRCFACSAKSIRGWSIPAGIMDEVAFFRVEGGANADEKVQTAIRRGGVALPRQALVKISTPYLKGGVLWDDIDEFYGEENAAHAREAGALVWRASTTLMNPAITEARLKRERAGKRRSKTARVEYDAEFAEDVSTFLALELLEAAVVKGRRELPPVSGTRYMAAVDPTGGGADAFTLAIVHAEWRGPRRVMVQDVLRGWSRPRGEKLDLKATVAEIAAVLKRYGLYKAFGDRYAGQWPVQEFRDNTVVYEQAERDKSSAYQEFEPWVTTGGIELLDHEQLLHEAALLEKRLKPGGKKPTIDHPKGAHDDYANAIPYFEEAIRLDPNYGRAYAALAMVYIRSAERRWTASLGTTGSQAYERGQKYLTEAMKLPTALAHQVAGIVLLGSTTPSPANFGSATPLAALAEFKEALSLDPGDSWNYVHVALALASMGRSAEAISYMNTAMRLDPHPPAIFMYYLGLAHFNLQRFEAAATSLEGATALNPDDQFPFLLLGATYGHLGRKEEAQSAIARANELAVQQGYFPVTISTAGRIYLFQLPDRERFRTGLRLAGVPDFLSEGSFATENRLTMDESRALFLGHRLHGRDLDTGAEWDVSTTANGTVTASGAWVSVDQGAIQFYRNRVCFGGPDSNQFCGTVLRNPGGTRTKLNEFIWDSVRGTRPFSQVE